MSPKTWFRLLGLSCLAMAVGLALAGCGRKVPEVKPAHTGDGSRSVGQRQNTRENGGIGRKYALLVGVRSYDHSKLSDLAFTENDAEEMARVLSAAKYEVVVLTTTRGEKEATKKPTKANIEAELKRLLTKVTKHDVVLIGLAGHGVQYEVKLDGKKKDESFFCPTDARLIDTDDFAELAKTMLPFRALFAQLDDSGAGSRLLLIDACRNEVGTSRNADTDAMPRPTKGTAALFSCKGGERAFETKKLGNGHGVFFYHVIEALEGAAKSEDGEVTWDDLTRHVRRAVVKAVPKVIGGGARQTPHLMANVEGDPILVRVDAKDDVPSKDKDARKSVVELPKDKDGGTKVVSPKDKDGGTKVVSPKDNEGKDKGPRVIAKVRTHVFVRVQTGGYADDTLETLSNQIDGGIVMRGAKGRIIATSKDESACLVRLESPESVKDVEVWISADKLEGETK